MSYYKPRTITFDNVHILDGFTVAGPKEQDGRLRGRFDIALTDDKFGQDTFEKAERRMFVQALDGVIAKANLNDNEIDAVLGGDLLNQIVSTSFAMKSKHIAFLGLYNACATFAESLILGATLINTGMQNVACISGSHFATAERQYRYPLELGVLRSPVTQWTVTGVGATVLSSHSEKPCPRIMRATIGRVMDYGVADANNMGAAMAPAAMDTLVTFFRDTETKPSDYDVILTGDLGILGKNILVDLMKRKGFDIEHNCHDGGAILYYPEQKTYQGGSGAGCSALVFNSQIMASLNTGEIKNALLVGTGALMSPTTSFQGDSIPSIAHLVEISAATAN